MKTNSSSLVIAGAILLGLSGQWLFYSAGLGLNLFLWTACLLGWGAYLAFAAASPVGPLKKIVWAMGLLLALTFCWREDPVLRCLNMAALLTCMLLLLATPFPFPKGYFLRLLGSLLRSVGQTLFGAVPLLAREMEVGAPEMAGAARNLARVALGLLLVVPVLVVFALLFSSADPVFANHLQGFLNIDASFFLRLCLAGLLAWLTAGYLRGWVRGPTSRGENAPMSRPLGHLEVNTALVLLNLLFGGFVWVQLSYLFGDGELVQVTPGLTFSEYARRGFFELVTASFLVLPLLMVTEWLMRYEQRRRVFQVLVNVLIFFLAIIIISAFKRMRLYLEEYGLTVQRFYATVLMLWLAGVFAWFLFTLWKRRTDHFIFGVVSWALAVVLILNVLNPHAFIFKMNMGRVAQGKNFDATYHATLSLDAAPPTLRALERLSSPQADFLQRSIQKRLNRAKDWRGWTLARWQARQALDQGIVNRPTK